MPPRPWLFVLLTALWLAPVAVPRAAAQTQPYQFPAPLVYERPPPSGIGGLVVGIAGLSLATLNLALLPVCWTDFYQRNDADQVCRISSYAFVAAGLAAAIPGLVIGVRRRKAYKQWRAEHRSRAGLFQLSPSIGPSAAGLSYRVQF